jgi:NitT/TauT family transport system substrate-binding protein
MVEARSIRLTLYSPGCLPGYHLPYFAAAAGGAFSRHGLDVQLLDPEPGPQNSEAVAAGRADACFTSTTHYLRAKAADPGLHAAFVFMVAAKPHPAAYVVAGREGPIGRPIRGFADLEGARLLGQAGSGFNLEYDAMLSSIGLAAGPSVDVPEGREITGLLAGTGDVMVEFVDVAPRLRSHARRAGQNLRVLPFHAAGLRSYGSGLVAGPELRRKRPEALMDLLTALEEALIETRRNPASGVEALRRRLRGVTPERAVEGWRASETLIFDRAGDLGDMSLEGWQETVDHFARVYGEKNGLDPESLFDSSFLTAARA